MHREEIHKKHEDRPSIESIYQDGVWEYLVNANPHHTNHGLPGRFPASNLWFQRGRSATSKLPREKKQKTKKGKKEKRTSNGLSAEASHGNAAPKG